MKFIDVNPADWFYKDVYDLSLIEVGDEKFIQGIPYNQFKKGKEVLDYEVVNTVSNQIEFTINQEINPSSENPLVVFIDGITTGVDDIKVVNGQTKVKLVRGVPAGAKVRFWYAGEPLLRAYVVKDRVNLYSNYSESSSIVATVNKGTSLTYNRMIPNTNWYEVYYNGTLVYVKTNECRVIPAPVSTYEVEFPNAPLSLPTGFYYDYDPFNYMYPEIVKWRGIQLKRVESKDKLSYDGLEYCIDYDDIDLSSLRLYTTYALNNEPIQATFIIKNDYGVMKWTTLTVTVHSDKIIYTNRFFPNLNMSRLEVFILMYRTLKYLIQKHSLLSLFDETPGFVSRFSDIQRELDASYPNFPWWWKYICPLEKLQLSNGAYILNGDDKGNLNIDYPVTRAELAALVNRLRKYIIEILK